MQSAFLGFLPLFRCGGVLGCDFLFEAERIREKALIICNRGCCVSWTYLWHPSKESPRKNLPFDTGQQSGMGTPHISFTDFFHSSYPLKWLAAAAAPQSIILLFQAHWQIHLRFMLAPFFQPAENRCILWMHLNNRSWTNLSCRERHVSLC